jgi:hypothetical protein
LPIAAEEEVEVAPRMAAMALRRSQTATVVHHLFKVPLVPLYGAKPRAAHMVRTAILKLIVIGRTRMKKRLAMGITPMIGADLREVVLRPIWIVALEEIQNLETHHLLADRVFRVPSASIAKWNLAMSRKLENVFDMIKRDLVSSEDGLLVSLPYHDARLTYVGYDLKAAYLELVWESEEGRSYAIAANGVAMINLRDLYEGNILSDIFLQTIESISAQRGESSSTAWVDLLVNRSSTTDYSKQSEALLRKFQGLKLLRVFSSYGCSLALICREAIGYTAIEQ